MANTYTKIYLHVVFAVKNRVALLPPHNQLRIFLYIRKILENNGHLPIAVGGTCDHVHLFFVYSIKQSIPDLVREIKMNTTKFIKDQHLSPLCFCWQKGYACFSYSHSQVDAVKNYVVKQNEHHRGRTLRDEIRLMFERFGVEYNEDYIFDDVD